MESEASKGDKKVHFRDSSSREISHTYKRRRRQQQEQEPPPQAQEKTQPEPQQQPLPQEQARAKPKPQKQPQPQAPAQSEPQPPLELKHNAQDVPVQESKDTFWKSRDMAWKYGAMIDENRQHWKCMYCGLIRVHLRKKRERRRKRAAQNGGSNIKTKSTSDDIIVGKDPLPADLVVPPETGTNILQEVTNQTSKVHQDPTCPRVPLLRTRDIAWEHAVDLDGNKRRWQCKFCSLCRSGGVTTLKAHLTDDSCPNVPREISKKISNFIKNKRALRLRFSNIAFTIDDDQVSDSQFQEEGTVQSEDDQQPSRNGTLECATNEVTNRSSQCSAASNGQPVEHRAQPGEQGAIDHGRMHQMASNKHQISNKGTKNSKNTKTLEPRWKRGFSTTKHIDIVDATARHWRCRYCGMDWHYVRTKKRLKRVKSGKQIPSGPHIVGQSGEEPQSINPLCGNHSQLPVNDESNEHGPSSHLEVPKDATEKIRNQIISKDEQNPRRSESFDRNDGCYSKSSQFDQEQFITMMHVRKSSQDLDHINSKSGACNTLSNPSQENINPLVCHKQNREDAGASPPVYNEQQREGAASPSGHGCLQGQRMQWLLQHKPITEEGPQIYKRVRAFGHAFMMPFFTVVLNMALYLTQWNWLMEQAVHQDGARSRYFDFDVIDSRMKSGDYGHEPTLFMHDLKLVWENLKMAGQNIIELANNLSSLTEASCSNLVEREKESGDNELKGAVVSSSRPRNFVESNALIPVDLDQSDPVDVSDIRKDSTCNQCAPLHTSPPASDADRYALLARCIALEKDAAAGAKEREAALAQANKVAAA
ncbi:hypothetical protein QOZ80_1BG0070930 [Eleusine coracana subsp. coracana]|nr:hypothetical protein QOZ80_1BG0070930 [Eleusine coracana subsp. coracana]